MSNLTITSPRDGDYLNHRDGDLRDGKLWVTVRGTCEAGAAVTINGRPAGMMGNMFWCAVPLSNRNETIEARAGDASASIQVLADLHSRKRYRQSIDDNIEFLRDLGTEPDSFNSLFDHWYLAFWKRMHDDYGTKVHINTYYQTEDGSWNTSMMPDKWRDEWEANANWLHLSFHAIQNLPNRIYENADYDRMAHDYELVVEQIKRYAGEAVLTSETTVHWAEAPRDACLALKDRGIDTLIGLFWVRDGQCTTKYYLDIPQAEYCHTRDAWQDTSTDLTFVSCDLVTNSVALDQVLPHIEAQAAGPHTGEMIELLIHEQYFRKELSYHQPDVMDKVEYGVRWLSEQGYEPCFWSEGLLGSQA